MAVICLVCSILIAQAEDASESDSSVPANSSPAPAVTTTAPPTTAATEPAASTTAPPAPLEGDANGDGRITAGDARLILRHSAYLIRLELPIELLDIDKNGRVSAADARIVLRRSARLPDRDETTTKRREPTTVTTTAQAGVQPIKVAYPSDDASWSMILLNTKYRVGNVDNQLKLVKVANSSEYMDYRAAAAYTKMYGAAARVGIYLTPCSGYRSYTSQYYLFEEFVQEYLSMGYSRADSERLASRRRMPAGSSEHNIGICMDIICAGSAYNFEYTREYAWLMKNAQDYGFILRYPADKTEITGVKFEPWHWRYVGVANAKKIKASGLCLEEYLGKA